MRRAWRVLTRPYRVLWRVLLDASLGEDELRGRQWPSTTPEWAEDHRGQIVVEDADKLGYRTGRCA